MGSLCLLCYKELSISDDTSYRDLEISENALIRFVKSICKQELSIWNKDTILTGDAKLCTNCEFILERYHKLVLQQECIKLKQQWELGRLKEVMKQANRVPERVKRFREICLKTGDSNRLNYFQKFRKMVYGSCTNLVKDKTPTVLLERCQNFQHTAAPVKTEPAELKHDLNISIKPDAQNKITEISNPRQETFDDNSLEIGIVKVAHNIADEGELGDDHFEPENISDEDIPSMDTIFVEEGKVASSAPVKPEANPEPLKRLRVKFKCGKCSRVFVTQERLSAHENSQVCMNAKDEESTESSDDCDDQEKSEPMHQKRRKVQKTDYQNENYTSSDTSPEPSEDEHEETKDIKHAISAFPCTFNSCNKVFKNELALEWHSKLHGDFTCNFCDFKTGLANILMDHETTSHPSTEKHKDSKLIKCSRCPKFLCTHRLRHFMVKHLGIDYSAGTKCHICGQGFASKRRARTLRRHIETMHGITGMDPDSVFKCKICQAPFVSDAMRAVHMIRVHKIRGRKCSLCDTTFKLQKELDRHLKRCHSFEASNPAAAGINLFRCEFPNCGKTFLEKYSLESHIHKHKTAEMLVCSTCGKKLMNAEGLKQHEGKHKRLASPVKVNRKACSVVCELCGKSFYGSSVNNAQFRLTQHLRTKMHSKDNQNGEVGSWTISCEQCGKLCQSTQKLEEHLRTHSKEQPFGCENCGRSFSIKYNLKRHMKLVHNITLPLEKKGRKGTEYF